jgi:SAM-dependent methyltransferase
MALAAASDPESTRRLAVYSYLRPLVDGRRVLEIGCREGDGAAHLLALGARAVVAIDDDTAALGEARSRHGRPGLTFFVASSAAVRESGPYDLVLVPRALELLRGANGLSISAVRGLLGARGRLACLVPSGDRPGGGGLGYYDVLDALAPHFARVRMFGQTPFAAYGVAEFDEAVGGLRVDSALVDEASEQPVSYLAVAGPDEPLAMGYALVQVPAGALPPSADAPAAMSPSELTRNLAVAHGQIEGGLRVTRAQAEELDELRARLRRAAEDRGRLDEEVSRLRRALAEADESVMSLTRRSTEEMAALAHRLTAGLRSTGGGEGPAPGTTSNPALIARLDAQQAALAARESALSERDERIAALEAERQDLVWRIEAAEEELERAGGPVAAAPSEATADEELRARLHGREQALEEYRRAAGAHLDEVERLRDALTEQSAAVVELEDALTAAQQRLDSLEQESIRLRRVNAEIEEADRQRRSRLAELEGTLLRLQRQAALQAAARPPSEDEQARLAGLERQLISLRDRLADAERQRFDAERRRDEAERLCADAERSRALADAAATDATARASALERVSAERDELAHSEEALRARIAEREEPADGAPLEAALAEADRLRAALDRSDEQLWETRGRLMADRERLEALERTLESGVASGPASGETQALIAAVVAELTTLENGLRAEAAQLAAVERALGEWRTALTADSASADAARRPAGET